MHVSLLCKMDDEELLEKVEVSGNVSHSETS